MKVIILKSLLLLFTFVAWYPFSSSSADPHFLQNTSPVTIEADFQIDGLGSNVDSIAFWEADEPNDTVMFVTGKGNSLVEVWKYPFVNHEQAALTHQTFGSSPVNGVLVDQAVDQLYVSIGESASTVTLFSLPEQTYVDEFIHASVNLRSEPNLALLNHSNGHKWLYVSADEVVYIHDALTGHKISEFVPPWDVETMVADDYYQALYIPDENDRHGIFAYQPDGTPYLKNGSNNFGNNNIFQSDGEGIILYRCEFNDIDYGSGFIAVSDQKDNLSDFEFFDRQSWEHLGTLNINGVSNTDGLASTQQAMNGYPSGILAAINNDSQAVGVGWDKVFTALDLSCQVPVSITITTFLDENLTQSALFLLSFIVFVMTLMMVWVRLTKKT